MVFIYKVTAKFQKKASEKFLGEKEKMMKDRITILLFGGWEQGGEREARESEKEFGEYGVFRQRGEKF